MTDDMAARLMAKMRGTREDAPEEPRLDPTTVALMEQASRGSVDYSSVHEANAKGQAEFERAVRRRAAELRRGSPLDTRDLEGVARQQLQREAQARSEVASRRATYDAMRENTRREGESTSTASLREDIRQATIQRRERADALLVARLQAITGAYRTA